MKIIGVIPARWASTRFPGKVLQILRGKPVVQHVWERAGQSRRLDEVIIACDDERVRAAAEGFGAQAVMTSPDHASGTDRIAEAIAGRDADIIINVQGDEPLIDPAVIDQLADALLDDPAVPMATVIKRLEDPALVKDPNVVKAVIDNNGFALYFSRAPIPFARDKDSSPPVYKHLGIYGYRRDFLLSYSSLPASMLERAEKLEQLRVLEAGLKIKTVITEYDSIGVDTPDDLKRIEAQLNKAGQS